jgi:hypothetical protein
MVERKMEYWNRLGFRVCPRSADQHKTWTAPQNWMGVPIFRGSPTCGSNRGYDGRECGASVYIEATDPPRRQAAHDALRHSISTQSVGGCIPTRSVRNDRHSIREQAHSHCIRASHGSVDQHKTWAAPQIGWVSHFLGAAEPVGAIGGYDGRECGASVYIEATDPPRRQAAHDALRHSISTQSVGGCIPTRSVRNDRDSIREHAHSHRIRACHGPVDQHTTWTAPKNWMGVPLFGGSRTCGSNRRLRRSRMLSVSDIDAADSPRRQAAHDALRHSISTRSVGGCIPTRSVRNDQSPLNNRV